MCGIFGIQFFDKIRKVDINIVKQATDTMRHRGPDDSGYWADKNIGLGHRRLSIIDLSSGHQPMKSNNGKIVLVFNGEIYNYREIKKELEAKGHKFKTNSDTEVIIHSYEEWGVECLNRFNGMFAFILYDKYKNRLWIVRDRLGIKPLYYYIDKNVFVAASEIKPILKTGLIKSKLNENVLDAYFSVGYVPGPETMFRDIKKLLPGHFLIVNQNGIKEREYWDFADMEESEISEIEALESINDLLIDSVNKRLISDVPLGAFLSGGLDSSAIVGMMTEITNKPVETFTVAYKQGYSEKNYADKVARHFNTNHHVFYLEADNFSDSLKTLVQFAEEPIVEPAAIALYHLSKQASKKATVLLSGEGSDELFAGYFLYQFMNKLEDLRHYIPSTVFSMAPLLANLTSKLKYKKYLDWIHNPLSMRYQGTSGYLTKSLKKKLYSPDFYNNKSTYLEEVFLNHFDKVKEKTPINQMLYVDTKTWLVDDLLVKADKMTMAASIELRVPFLDHRLIEAVTKLPADMKIKNGQGKYLLKKIAESLLPNEIIYRKKRGFPVPTNEWFKGDLIPILEDTINFFGKGPWFKKYQLEKILTRQKRGYEDHSKFLMTLLVFSEWQNQNN